MVALIMVFVVVVQTWVFSAISSHNTFPLAIFIHFHFRKFHMERSKAIFDWVFALDSPARAPYKLIYLVSPDIGLTAEVLAARKEKELKSLATVQKYAKEIRSMRQLWYFLNHQHSLYTASKLIEGGVSQLNTTTAELVKKSYGGG